MRLIVSAPAKVNLGLKVLGRRPDGYHELLSLMQPLDLADGIALEPAEEPGIKLVCLGADLPNDRSNLAFRAAETFLAAAGISRGSRITLTKRVPVAAGLGGGSSDAAAVLKGLNSIFDRPLSEERLCRLALELGADVPFFIPARAAWATGVGEILHPVDLPRFHYLLINPGFEVSTAWVFGRLRNTLTPPPPRVKLTFPKIASVADLAPLANDLEAVVQAEWPVIGRLKQCLLDAGAMVARMSGSGPTVFGVFQTAQAAASAAGVLEREESWRVITAQGL